MGLVILGLIMVAIGFAAGKSQGPLTAFKGMIKIAGIVIALVGGLTSTIRIIDAGTVGVVKVFGSYKEVSLTEGMHIVEPWASITTLDIKTQNYTMSSTSSEGSQSGDDAIKVLSKDGLEVKIDLTILYKIVPDRAPIILRETGVYYEAKVIRPQTRTRLREISVYYNATDLYSEKREEFESRITTLMEQDFKSRGIILEQMLIRKVDLPESVKQSIERKITAVQEAQRMEYVLQKETQEAERKRVEARGVADAQKIINSGLSPKLLRFEQIKMQKELAKSPNSKIIIMGESKNTPFIIGK